MDCNPPGSFVHRIFQARILEQVATSYSRGFSRSRDQTRVSCIAGGFFTTELPPDKLMKLTIILITIRGSHLIGNCINTWPGVKYKDFMRLGIGVHNGLKVFFIFFASLPTHPYHGLATPSDCGLTFRMNP